MSSQAMFHGIRMARPGLLAGLLLVWLAIPAAASAQDQDPQCGGHRQRACALLWDTLNDANTGCDSGKVELACFDGLCAGTFSTSACVDPAKEAAYDHYGCGKDHERACTVFERYAGSDACSSGNDQVPCFGGLCAGTFSTSACVSDYFMHFACGGRNQRACTVFEAAGRGACRSGLRQVGPPCPGGVCAGTTSITACVDPDDSPYDVFDCGNDGERACIITERYNGSGACQENLYEVPCFGDACQGTVSTSACTSDYFSIHDCGGDGQRACTLFERGAFQGNPACRPNQNLLEYACSNATSPPEGACGGSVLDSFCEYGFVGFARGSVPRQIVTTLGSMVTDLAQGMTLGRTNDDPAVGVDGIQNPIVEWGDGRASPLATPDRTPDSLEFPNCEACDLVSRHHYQQPGQYIIRLRYHEHDFLSFPLREATIPVTVAPVTDGSFVIASIGDSVASGEGVPNSTMHWKEDPLSQLQFLAESAIKAIYGILGTQLGVPWPYITVPAVWADGFGPLGQPLTPHPTDPSLCHRSRWAGPAQAATQLQRENPNTLVQLFHEACTGGQVGDEVIEQLDTLSNTPVGGGPGGGSLLKDVRVDALLVSGGANDAGFLIETMNCLDPGAPGHCYDGSRDATINEKLATLPGSYQALNNKIAETLPNVANVYITEYFDPTHDMFGNFPDDVLTFDCTGNLMTQLEWQFMHDKFIVPVNGQVRAGAAANGWQFVGGIQEGFRMHGFCAGAARWVVNLFDSAFSQGDQGGTAHPNREGHAFIADKIVKKIYGQNVPVTEASVSPAAWTNQDVRVSLAARGAFNLLGSRPSASFFAVDKPGCGPSSLVARGACTTYGGPFTIADEGTHRISFFSKSQGGVFEDLKTVEAFIDKTPPSIAGVQAPAPNGAGWNNTEVTVSFDCSDALSGLAGCLPAAYTLEGDGVGQVVNGDATDLAGNTATATVTGINIDRTPPTIGVSRAPDPNPNGWNKTDVTVNFTCADVPSGIATCPGPVVTSAEGAGQTIEGTAMDLAGNPTTAVTGINIDRTPPTVSGSWTPTPNANGWNNLDVTVKFVCADELSGLAACSPDAVVTAEGANQSVPGSATDRADNTGPGEVTGINIDRTRPTVTATRAPSANGHGWNNAPVTVSFACGDALSGVAACPQNVVVGTEGVSQTADGTVSDRADNASTATVDGINIDRTPPAIAGSRAPMANAFGWNNAPVTVSFTCDDALSGIDGCSGPQVLDEEGEAQARRGTAVDRAGNEAGASVGAIRIDLTPPDIAITSPTSGPHVLRSSVASNYSCIDQVGLSGVNTCAGTVANGANIDTASVGGKNFTVSAGDVAGNPAMKSVTYSVQYLSTGTCLGEPTHQVLQPINADGSRVFKAGSTVPVKFRVCDALGTSIGTAGVVATVKLIQTTNGTAVNDVDELPVSTSADTQFRWDPTAQQWVFNLSTKGLATNLTYSYQILLNDQTAINFRFGLK